MPFQSEKQRRYLWANEPEIARDWTDRYGAAGGGIMHNFANYAHDDGSNVSVPRSFQARPHSDQVNLAYITPEEQGILQALKPDTPHEGPMGIPNYDSFDAAGNYSSGAAMSAAETGGKTDRDRRDMAAAGISPQQAQNIRSGAIASGAGQTVNPGWFGPRHRPGISKQDLRAAKQFAPKAYRNTRGSNFGIGNLFRGAMSMFGGWPGKVGSMLSHINPNQLRGWNEEEGRYNTQDEWESARTNRRRQSRLDNLYSRKSLGKGFSQKNIDMLEAMGLKPSTAQNVDSGRGSNLRGKELTKQLSTPKRSLGQIVMDSRRKFPIDNSMYGADLQGFGLPKNVPGGMPNTYYMENWGGDGITYDNDASYAITDDMGWKGHQNMTHANAPQGVKDLYNQRFRERYGDQGLASFNDPWAGPEFQQAKGTTWQEFLQDTSPAAAFDPAIHNSWQDVYQSWLNQNTFS